MEKRLARQVGWLRRDTYKEAISVSAIMLEQNFSDFRKSNAFARQKSVISSFGMPQLGKELERYVMDGGISEPVAVMFFKRALLSVTQVAKELLRVNPEFMEEIKKDPKAGIQKYVAQVGTVVEISGAAVDPVTKTEITLSIGVGGTELVVRNGKKGKAWKKKSS
ncbi:MAG: hypothetical protein KGH94_04810 [Candidatus Micrarchaeota archaeon]|nr:hypothetical protein [Candidatus Micrarchaeota archaeon]